MKGCVGRMEPSGVIGFEGGMEEGFLFRVIAVLGVMLGVGQFVEETMELVKPAIQVGVFRVRGGVEGGVV